MLYLGRVFISLRSRRLEAADEGENGRARVRHAGGESPSRAPVFSCAHYFQAPATQARCLYDCCNFVSLWLFSFCLPCNSNSYFNLPRILTIWNKLCLKVKKKERSQYPGARNLRWLVLENWGAIRPGNEVDTAETYPGRSGMKPGEVGRVTWVNFSWVCAAGLSEPLSHYSLFCCQV